MRRLTKKSVFSKLAAAIAVSMLCGCLNICYRCPGTSHCIETTYQATKDSFVYSYVIMFPQTMSPGHDGAFVPMNFISVPIGCICFLDVPCECVLDTLFWPFDKMIEQKHSN